MIARGSVARRLLVGQTLVLVGMTVSIVAAAVLIGPAVFDEHMRRAGHADQPDVLEHAEEAFYSAGSQALAVGLLVAIAGALVVTLATTRRLGGWLTSLSVGADRMSAGHYEEPVQLAGASPELERVATAFNGMAAEIQTTESRRRSLLTDVAHELRTPIATIDVTLEALEDGVLVPDAETYATLRAQSARLARLAADIRDVSAAEEGHPLRSVAEVATADLLNGAEQRWSRRYDDAQVTLSAYTQRNTLVCVDRARIDQVLDNLLANALRHTPPTGSVRIRAGRHKAMAVIEVVDDGEGIDAASLAHVMERFYRADPGRASVDGSGTGVGLAISRAIARSHDGDLVASSEGPGLGATFALMLPTFTKS